jgi:hypothetical protein
MGKVIIMRPAAVLVCLSLALSGCATAGARGVRMAPEANRAVVAEYAQTLPAGTAIRVQRTDGRTVRGTLMKATSQSLVIQPRVRIPEPPLEIALTDVISVAPEQPGRTNIAKAIGIGAAAGAGAALAVILIVIAIYSD